MRVKMVAPVPGRVLFRYIPKALTSPPNRDNSAKGLGRFIGFARWHEDNRGRMGESVNGCTLDYLPSKLCRYQIWRRGRGVHSDGTVDKDTTLKNIRRRIHGRFERPYDHSRNTGFLLNEKSPLIRSGFRRGDGSVALPR